MTIHQEIMNAYPELSEIKDIFVKIIQIQDDCDGEGLYIAQWNYSKPLPQGMKVGK